MTKVYISGAITGLDYHKEVVSAFDRAAKDILAAGCTPVNPLDNGLPLGSCWTAHMKADIKMLLDCQEIYMLDGWEHSKGAWLEWQIANQLGMRDFHLNINKKSISPKTDTLISQINNSNY